MAETVAEQLSRVGVTQGGRRSHFTTLGVPLLTEFMNFAVLIGLLFLLQLHRWALPSRNILAFVALIGVGAVLSAFRDVGSAVWRRNNRRRHGSTSTQLLLPIGSSVNDNLATRPAPPGAELADALRRSRSAFLGVGLLSGLINILMLTGPLF